MSEPNRYASPPATAQSSDVSEEEVFVFPLSFAQRRLWFLHQLDPQSVAYNMPFALRLTGQLDVAALERTLNEIVRRHEVLRTTFDAWEEEPVQLIAATQRLELPLTDLSGLPSPEREAEARRLALEDALRPFDFARGPMLRAGLLRLGAEEHVLSLTLHHIVSDGWSMGVLVREVAALYAAFAAGRPSPLEELPIQYADYAEWQRSWLEGEVLAEQLSYWRGQLAGAPPALELPTDRPRPAVQSFKGAYEAFSLSEELSDALKQLCQREGVTLFVTLLAAFQTLLYRYTGQEDIVVGSPVANRNQTAAEQLIGFFTNTLVLRTRLSARWSFRDLLAHVRETCVGALAHQDLPFEKLVEDLRPERSRSHSPLFQVMFASQNTPEQALELPRLRVSPFDLGVTAALFDLTLNILETDEQTYGSLHYNTDLFEAGTIRRMCGNFVALLESIAADPERRLSQLPLLTEGERRRLLYEWNETGRDYASDKCLPQLFEEQVERSPDAVALRYEDETLTYAELNARANQLAHHLRGLGVAPELRVALLAERSTEMVVGILGILKAGAAFVPLDPQHPFERLSFMLEDAQPPVVVTQECLLEKLPAHPALVVLLDEDGEEIRQHSLENPPREVTAGNLAYVTYTSGSTGQPKGVLVEHGHLCNTMFAAQEAFALGAGDVMSCVAPFAFDIFNFELMTPLLSGAQCLLVSNRELLDAGILAGVLEKLTCIQSVPVLMRQMLNSIREDKGPRRYERIRHVFIGGEAVAPELLREMRRAFPSAQLNVLYGPTEATIICSQYRVTNAETLRHQMIGVPLGNMRLHLCDAHGNPVPIGVAGEICIGGASVARGYLNRPALTAEKFIPDSLSREAGARLYKSGDRGRYLPDGNIEFLGREDEQVKMRGFRIEPGEIEAVLGSHPAVREAVVSVREDTHGDKRLIAYLVLEPGASLGVGELRGYLKERLPEYMVPTAYVFLDSLPLTPNGKLDRRALPAPDAARPELEETLTAPRTVTEERLAALFAQVLGLKEVGIYDNFFDLGGHSLLATQVVSRVREAFQVEVPLDTLFEAPTVEGLAESIDAHLRAHGNLKPIRLERVARTGTLPLSYAQQRLWFIHQLEPDSPAYNIPLAVRLTGHLDPSALARSLSEIVRRHEALRTTFSLHDARPYQLIHPPAPIELPLTDLSALPGAEREQAAQRIAEEEARLPFDLGRGPLLRARLLRLDAEEHVLLFTTHHIVSDGWSLGVLVREVGALYGAYSRGEESPLEELEIQYADYAAWQRGWLTGEVLERQLAYWRERLAGAATALELPTDRPRPAAQTFRGSHQPFVILQELTSRLREVSRREGVTLFMLLLAGFKALLYRYTGERDLVVGSPIAGRNFGETEGLIGFFVNTVALRTDMSGDPRFVELVARVREGALGAYAHQDVPFEKLVEELQPERLMSHSPLYQVMFELQNAPVGELALAGLKLWVMAADNGTAKYDLTLNLQEAGEEIGGSLGYSTDLFEAETIGRMVSHFLTLLEDALEHTDRRVSELELLSAEERGQLAFAWNDTQSAYPQDKLIHELFELQVERQPESIALVCEGEEMTYAELNRRAETVACRLQQSGVRQETLVGVGLERSIEMVVALLGILKAGGAFVSFDLTYPKERLAFLLEDTQVPLLLTRRRLLEKLPPFAGEVLFLEEDGAFDVAAAMPVASGDGALPERKATKARPEQLAYVFYTSGSTGRPKGVLTSHRGVVNYLTFNTGAYQLSAADVVLQMASLSFDASVRDILGPLVAGARLVLVDNTDARDPEALLSRMSEQRVTCLLSVVPSLLHALTEAAGRREHRPEDVRLILTSGENLLLSECAKARAVFGEGLTIVNQYGATECTMSQSYYPVPLAAGGPGVALAGRPIANAQLYILDERLRLVPAGVSGEVYIGGAGVARGYLNSPAQTAEKFIPHPFSREPGSRLYRTGDLARYRHDGQIELLGRIDHQVKLRGLRIELAEIEGALNLHEDVREAVVLAREDVPGEKRLVAYVVAEGERPRTLRSMRDHLKERLPEYMVPTAYVFLDSLPLTPNGKLDRQALPAPDTARPELEETFAPPSTPSEEVLAGLWADILGVERVGIHDNFFELGGHSLLATQVVSRIRELFHVEIALRQLFETPTVAGVAQSVEGALKGAKGLVAPSIERVPREGRLPLSFAQQRLWFIEQMGLNQSLYNVPLAVRLTGRLDSSALSRTLSEIVRRHEALRTTFAVHDARPFQLIHPPTPLDLPVEDLTSLAGAERERVAQRIADEEAGRPFDLERGPLLRARLLRLSAEEHVLLLTMHHIVSDGWSLGVLVNEVGALYGAYSRGEESPLEELRVQYADYAVWQRGWLTGEVLERQLSYWREQLAGAPAVLELPTDRPRPPVQSFRGGHQPFVISERVTAGLKELSRREGVTLFMVLLAAFKALLYRYTGEREVLVGSPIAGRNYGETEALIGFFVNTVALRTELSGEKTFGELLARVREVALGAYLHQDVPFEKLVEELQPERALSHTPIFQVVFVLQNAPVGELALAGLKLWVMAADNETAKYDLTLNLQEAGEEIGGSLGYSTDLFEAETIGRMVAHFLSLLEGVAADVNTPLSQLPLLSEEERRQIVFEWNATEKEYPVGRCIHELFTEQVERTPEAAAVIYEEEALTYRELEQRANQLARYLQSLGVRPGTHVGIHLEHSLETVIGILAVLKTGAAYVPLDPEHPRARLGFIIEEAQIGCVLTQQRLKDRLPAEGGVKLVYLDADWETFAAGDAQAPLGAATPESVAYVIYTSGSTGQPKGVRVQHKALVNYICWAKDVYVQGEQLSFALYSSLAFDLTVTSLYTPLVTGGTVFVYRPAERQSPVVRILEDRRVDVLKLTPSHLALVKDLDNSERRVKRLIVGGEALETKLARRVYESFGRKVEIFNEYGPTEATVGCMIARFDAEGDERAYVPIGRPAANVQIYVLDEHLQPVPENVSGELYISGAGLAAGYLNRDEQTQERFIDSPFRDGEKMYRSGDVARRLPGGEIEYIGRRDEQVKFHGYRVELNEVRSALNGYRQVRDSVVLLHRDAGGNDALVAYYAARQEIEPEQLREHLSEHLLKETIPNFFVHLKRLPLTLNGKVNHAALPTLEEIKGQATRPAEHVAPQTEIEEIVAGIWAMLLGVPQVGRYANFFQLGGHSLLATQVVSRVRDALHVELTVLSLFEHPTVQQLSTVIESLVRDGRGEQIPPIIRVDRDAGLAPLSYAQQRLWFIHQLEPDSPAYNIPLAVRLTGALDPPALARTLSEVVRRHEALRTTFAVHAARPFQVIHPPAPLDLPVEDLTALAAEERERAAQRIADDEARRPFDLARGPLLRARLLRLTEDEHVLLCTMHHIVADGWSMGVLIKEVGALYGALSRGAESPLGELALQYADYAVWQRDWLRGEVLERQLAYWRKQLEGAPAALELPSDRPRPAVQTFRGSFEPVVIEAELTRRLKEMSRREGVTLFMLLLAAWQVLLSRYTGEEDVVVGTPIANRNRGEVEQLIGFFVNALALRTDLSGDPTFGELLQRVREVALGAYLHQDVPFEKLVEELQPERSLSYNPLFQVVFALENTPESSLQLSGLNISGLEVESETAKFDLRLSMSEINRELMGTLRYSTDLFDPPTIQRMLGHFKTLLQSIADKPEACISELSLLSEEEERALTEQVHVARPESPVGCLHRLFEAQVERTPGAIAVTFENEQMTYAELNRRANQLAHQLRALGVGPEVLVGLYVERGIALVIGILGILKAGGAYVPLDPNYPRERVAFMLDDARISVLLTQRRLASSLPECTAQIIELDSDNATLARQSQANPSSAANPDNLAYVIYTSGSTGRAKGVLVSHANAARLFSETEPWFSFDSSDVWTLFHSCAFDFSVWELWGALLYGGRLVIVPHLSSRSPEAFYELLSREKVTVLNQTPSAFRQLMSADESRGHEAKLSLRLVIFGGEALELQSLKPWFERHGDRRPQLVNMYGITETTVHVTYRPLTVADLGGVRGSRIGGAIPDLRVYVLDRHLRPVPDLLPGELCVGGRGVARGYLNRGEICAERFVPDALSGERGARLYRSGDLVRRLPGGDIEYLGRIDQQVKIRGYRIELGEIEAALNQHEAVRETVVVAREDAPGEKRLVCYLVWVGGESVTLEVDGLREFLRRKLPDYMIPSAFVTLERIPLTPNGKVDRRALPAPVQTRPALGQQFIAPRNELERVLASMWREILGIEQVGVGDNFFDLGGDSIRGAIFVNRLQERLGEIVHVVVIFTMPTVEQLAQYLAREYAAAVSRLVGEGTPRQFEAAASAAPSSATVNETMLAEVKRLIRPLPARVEGSTDADAVKNPPAVFILSPPRSGTTLLRVMLAGHPRLFAPPELELLSFNTLAERRAAFTGKDSFWLEGTLRAIMELKGCDADEAQHIMLSMEERGLTTKECYRQLQAWLGERLLVDKTPSYALDGTVLEKAEIDFENALYVHLLRHPSGMIHSFEEAKLEQIFFRYEHSYARRELAELIWTLSHRNILEFLQRIPRERQHRVKFEDLLNQPRPVMEGLCQFLGLSLHEGMLQPYEDRERRMTDGIHAESRMLGDVKFHSYKGIDARVGERWRRQPAQNPLAEITWEVAELFGYERDEKRAAPAVKHRALEIPALTKSGATEFPLSFAQQRLWFLDQMEQGHSATYNIGTAVRLRGALHVTALRRSLDEVLRRHSSLRTSFRMDDGQAVQVIAPPRPLDLRHIDLGDLTETEREAESLKLATEEAQLPFDLTSGPLLRATLVRLGAEEHILLVTMHHIVSDGWSMGVLVREVAALYAAFAAGRPSPLEELPIQYADYAEWQRSWLEGEVLAEQLSYWREQLAGAPPVLELPTDRPRPPVQSFKGAAEPLSISAEVSESLRALGRREGVTMFMLLLAAWQVLLSRYTGADEVVVGAPVAGRNRAEVEGLIGFFVNTLVLRTDLSGNPRFRDALKRVHEVVVGAFAHQDVPFEKLVEELQPERSLSHTPIFQVMFALQNAPTADEELPGLSLSAVEVESGTAKTDLALTLVETDRGLLGSLSYATGLFDGSTIRRMLSHFERLLESIAADADARVWDLALMTPAEEGRILSQCREEARISEQNECVQQMFESQVKRAPDALALTFEDERVTYGELNARANQLAHYLRAAGAGREVLVGILLENSVEMIVALLGVLKAGAAYVPLDPEYPEQRLRLMLKDARVPLLITQRRLRAKLPHLEARAIYLDDERELIARQSMENPSPDATPENLAYVIYTSGSTGTPKGVMIEHRGLSNLAAVLSRDFAVRAESRILQFASFSFDVSVLDVHTALSSGATLCLGRRETLMPGESLSRVLREQGITNVTLPPSALAVMPAEELPQLQTLISGGEACSADIVRRWSPGRRFLNGYGPTETTVCATFSECLDGAKTPTIGRAIGGTEVYVLDRQLRPVPVGALGEIYIGGVGVARGYLNLPELTAERFVPHPFSRHTGERLYRTGDRARLLPGGEIDYQGRVDEQLKVRGFRIEPGEIENALRQNPSVHEALVAAREEAPGDKRLVAYVVKRQGSSATVNELRDSLKERLPEYMIPSTFVFLEELPLTPQGKYDRRALPAPQHARSAAGRRVAPRNLLELRLTEQWEELLRVPVGVTDDFFEMGGHSLLAVRLMSRIEQLYGRKLPLAALFKAPTVESLSALLRQETDGAGRSPLVPVQAQGSGRPFFCVHPVSGNVLCYRELARRLGSQQPFYGLQARGLDDEQEPQTRVEAMAGDYLEAVRAVQPRGPYLLGGWSVGGLIAFEMARQLQARGEEVRLLALFDTKAPNVEVETEVMDDTSLLVSFALHLGLSPAQMRDVADALSEAQPEDYLSFMLERAKAANIVPEDMSLAHLRQQFRVFNANIHAARGYRPANHPASVALFRAEERASDTQTDATLGWGQVGVGNIEVYDTPGSHLTIMQEPYVSVLAERLAKCIKHAQSV
jgi:amino acid adenylation domain-containing protein